MLNKKIVFGAALAAILASSLAFADDMAAKEKNYQLPKCKEAKVSLMIGKLSCKATGCGKGAAAAAANPLAALLAATSNGAGGLEQMGEGMSDMLTTSLQSTGCFDIQSREELEAMKAEVEAAGGKLEIKPADIMVAGSITSIGMDTNTTSFGGGFIPIIGGISNTTKKANVTMDIRILDIKKGGKLIDSKTFESNSEKSSMSMFGGALFSSGGGLGGFGGGLSSLKGTVLEEVARAAIIEATIAITEKLAAGQITERVSLVAKKD